MTSYFRARCFRNAGVFYAKQVFIKNLSKFTGIWIIDLVSPNKNNKIHAFSKHILTI